MKGKTILFVAVALMVTLLAVAYVGAGASGAASTDGVTAPLLINIQGTLTDPGTGEVVPDDDYSITFSLYDVPSGGTALWSEPRTVTVVNGLFNVLLGSVTPLSLDDFTGTTYLGVKVGADPEMTPRQQVVSVAYALYAQEAVNADTVDGEHASAFAGAGHDHWGETWSGSGVGLSLTGGSTGLYGSGTSYGVHGESTNGYGGYFNSVASHALVTDKPSLIAGPNPKQIALLRWYEANEVGNTFGVGDRPLDMAFDGANIWVANHGSNTVTKLQANDGTVLGTYPVGNGPQGIAFDGANIWVTNRNDNTVTKLRASDGMTVGLGTYPVGAAPRGAAFDGANIWVANWGGTTVTKLRASDGALQGTYTVGSSPDHIAFDGANVWITKRYDNTVIKMRASDGYIVDTYSVGTGPEDLCFDGANIWVANVWSDDITKLRASDGATLGTYPIGSEVWSIAFDGSNIWAIAVYTKVVKKLDADTGTIIGSYSVGRAPQGLVFDGANIWVSNYDDDNVQKL
jgi:hypothetical protein